VEATGYGGEQPLEQVSKIKEQRSNCIIKISVRMKKEAPDKPGRFYLYDPDLLFRSVRKRLIFCKTLLS